MDDLDVLLCLCLWKDGVIQALALDCPVHENPTETNFLVNYVGFGNKDRQLIADFNLGYGVFRAPDHGFRRALWDFCHGYVSGFRIRDILWFVATHSFRK